VVPNRNGKTHWHKGVRVIALFEAAKGILVLTAGMGLLALAHRNLQALAEQLIRWFHLDPAGHYPKSSSSPRVKSATLASGCWR